MVLKRFFKGLLDLIYPYRCLVCQDKIENASIDNLICLACWNNIKRNVPPFCRYCGRHLKDPKALCCELCRKKKYCFDRAFSPCIYEGTLKELIHQFKYSGKDYLGETLCRFLSEFIKEYGLAMNSFDCVVAVPLHGTKLREREFNQAQILAEKLAGEFKLEFLKDALLRTRNTRTQTELKGEERLRNVKGCFKANPEAQLKDKSILLIDDLLTTGATCSEAAGALKDAGARQVTVLTLAN